MKLSSAKVTAPGRKQVSRRAGRPDAIALAGEVPPDSARPLLRTVMRGGRRTRSPDHWRDARERFREDLAALPGPALRFEDPEPLLPVWSEALARLTASVRAGFGTRLRPAGRVTPPDTAVSHSVPLSAHTR